MNPVLAKELSVYTPEEIRSAIAHLEAQRATRQAASKRVSSTVNPVEKGTRWTPTVDPETEARVHDVDPGLASADLSD